MKRLAIAVLITLVASLAGCTKEKVTETPGSNQAPNKNVPVEETSPKNDNMGDISKNIEQGKKNVEQLYIDLEANFKSQTSNFEQPSWEKFVDEFHRIKENTKKIVAENVYLNEAITNLESLYEEYNRALRENVQIGKEKVEGIKSKIEENLKKVK